MENLLILGSNFFAGIVDEIPGAYVPVNDLGNDVSDLSIYTVTTAVALLIILVVVSAFMINKLPKLKAPLFSLIAVTIFGATVTLLSSSIYLSQNSDSNGSIEVWACGNEIELRDPIGLSDKIGSWNLHEKDDRNIHIEGVIVNEQVDATLGKFFYVIGGAITDSSLVVPLNEDQDQLFENSIDGDGPSDVNTQYLNHYLIKDGENGRLAYFQDSQSCGQQTADVQVFVYKYDPANDTYIQTKLDNPRDYVLGDYQDVPAGDCVIVEFDEPKDKTDKLCSEYGQRDIERCLQFGVEATDTSSCVAEQADYDSSVDYRIYQYDESQLPTIELEDQSSEVNL